MLDSVRFGDIIATGMDRFRQFDAAQTIAV